ncbi:hypothetical protein [Agaribacterium haliotis]|uniref:hypothetical protein n=1 Tax=Agaribacterium haliotis TaxID=2013869 RepID=UPI000BB53DB5|nr:hypothetical protein [Agaribacterium haliotis]
MIGLKLNTYNRWQAFAIHFCVSILIFLAALVLIVFFWFPGPLLFAGGIQGILIVAAIDLVLGPLLTLLVYNPNKKSLPFDLTVIALLQVAALIYGLWTIRTEQPVAIVLDNSGINIIGRTEPRLYDTTLPEPYTDKIPIYVLNLPNSISEANTIAAAQEFIEGRPLYLRTDLYLVKPSTEQLELYLNIFEQKNECLLAPLNSKHIVGERNACLDIKNWKLQSH